jgi:hypothetical protein
MMGDISDYIHRYSRSEFSEAHRKSVVSIDYCRELAPCWNCGYLALFDLKKEADREKRALLELLVGGPIKDTAAGILLIRSVGVWSGIRLLVNPQEKTLGEKYSPLIPPLMKLVSGGTGLSGAAQRFARASDIWDRLRLANSPKGIASQETYYFIWPYLPINRAEYASGLNIFKTVDEQGINWALPDKSSVQTKVLPGPQEELPATSVGLENDGDLVPGTGREIEFIVRTNMATCTAHPYHGEDDYNFNDPVTLLVRYGRRKILLQSFNSQTNRIPMPVN